MNINQLLVCHHNVFTVIIITYTPITITNQV